MVPFQSRYLYHPSGSASIKTVLPAFVPELSYADMAISDGNMASRKFLRCMRGMVSEAEKAKLFSDLRQYCEMDTHAEFKLIEKLHEIGD